MLILNIGSYVPDYMARRHESSVAAAHAPLQFVTT